MDALLTSDNVNKRLEQGFIYTFYSYKGGVGRSMALANVGVLMALWGYRVLLVDWDLEAPGLEAFFSNAAKITGKPEETPGIIDLIEALPLRTTMDWRNCLLHVEFIGLSLDLISSGCKSTDYRKRVQQLNWESLFQDHGIGNYMNRLREEWKRNYDFVLIDSRTGITDIGDICTVLLPDVLVLFFISNYQNINGIRSVMERATAARKKLPINRSKLLGLPIPARDEVYSEYDKSIEWKRIYAKELGYLYREWLPKELDPEFALNKLFIPYVTNWSFGERIPVLESQRELQDPTSIGSAYSRLTKLLINRLDWNALENSSSSDELQDARLELQRLRVEKENLSSEREKLPIADINRSVLLRYSLLTVLLMCISITFIVTSYFLYKEKSELQKSVETTGGAIKPVQSQASSTPTQVPSVPTMEELCMTLHLEYLTDKAVIEPKYYGEVGKVANFMKRFPQVKGTIEGYTDNVGSAEKNLKLSQYRAENIVKMLVEKYGIDKSRLLAKGYGITRPIADNMTEEGRQMNRRIIANFGCVTVEKSSISSKSNKQLR